MIEHVDNIIPPIPPLLLHHQQHLNNLPRPQRARVLLPERLSRAYDRWLAITSDLRILELVRNGLRFDMHRPPVGPRAPPIFRGSDAQLASLHAQLDEWLATGVIEPCIDARALFALLFPVPKPGNRWRWVLDSRRLNDTLTTPIFKMEGVDVVRRLMRKGDYLTSIDLKDAFLHVKVNRAHRRFLAFRALGRNYQFAAMSFGTAIAPATFTRLMKPVLAQLRRENIRVSCYMDDMIIMAPTSADATRATLRALALLTSLGFTPNYDKSVLLPTQRIMHLGLLFDSSRQRLYAPLDKLRALSRSARAILRHNYDNTLTVRRLARLTGTITSLMPAMYVARRRRHSLARCCEYALRKSKQNWDAPLALSRTALADATWWATLDNLTPLNGVPLSPRRLDATLTTDASAWGWGATLEASDGTTTTTQSPWTADEARRSSNWRESMAITRAYFHFATMTTTTTIAPRSSLLVRTDNSTAVSTLRRWGSRYRHLDEALSPVLNDALRHRIDLRGEHIAGVDNWVADQLSRNINNRNDWRLTPKAVEQLRRHFNCDFTVDWLASAFTTHCRRYGTIDRHDEYATYFDAMHCDWRGEFGLVVPPFNLAFDVLCKILDEPKAHGIVVLPCWPAAPWAALLPWRLLYHLPPTALQPTGRHPMRDERSPSLVAFKF